MTNSSTSSSSFSSPLEQHLANYRANIRGIFGKVFEHAARIESEKWAKLLERHIYHWTIDECHSLRILPCWENVKVREMYRWKVKALLFNLDARRTSVKNATLLPRVLAREVSLKTLVYSYSHRDYMPERYVAYDAEIAEEWERIHNYVEVVHDGALKCRRCKSMKTVYVMVQTRSADEPSTLKVECKNCGLRWSQSA